METYYDEEVQFFESEVDLCHALLDIAGPKPPTDLISKARLGYEHVVLWAGTVHEPARLGKITKKLDRLRERLAGSPAGAASASMNLRVTTAR